MARPVIKVTRPDFSRLRGEAKAFGRAHRLAAVDATDLAGSRAQRRVQAKMRAAGLGNLSRAVGFTSAKRKRQLDRTPYAAIYAKGGDESRAGGALEAYSRGATIRAQNSEWLAYATDAVPKRVGRRKMTPKLYNSSGLVGSIGKLVFRKVKPNLALLVLRKVSLSAKTGQARALGKRAPRTRIVPEKDVVAFVLIKQTRRAKRFDKDLEVGYESRRVPDYIARILAGRYR